MQDKQGMKQAEAAAAEQGQCHIPNITGFILVQPKRKE